MTDYENEFDVQSFARGINELLVLSTLREGAKHGYQIALDVEDGSNGLVRFRHGTLYPILHRLEREGWISGSWARGEGRRRKVYRLSRPGRRHLAGEADRLDRLMALLLSLVRGPEEASS